MGKISPAVQNCFCGISVSTLARYQYSPPVLIKFWPSRAPGKGVGDGAKFNQLEMVTTFTYKPSLAKIDARNFELSW